MKRTKSAAVAAGGGRNEGAPVRGSYFGGHSPAEHSYRGTNQSPDKVNAPFIQTDGGGEDERDLPQRRALAAMRSEASALPPVERMPYVA